MTQKNRLFALALIVFSMAVEAGAMVYEPIKLTLWRRGETIAGEEFVAANEAVMDYIATLRRPTEALKGIRYQCQAKGQYIRPSVRYMGASNPNDNAYVDVRTVYELKDCAEAH